MPTTDPDDAAPGRAYIPQAGSLADRVCKYFTRPLSADDELTTGDIATKFDAQKGSVQQCLMKPVLEQLLERAQTDDGIVYRRGPRLGEVYAAPSAPTAHAPFPAVQAPAQQQRTGRGGPRTRLPPLDVDAIAIEERPLPPAVTERRPGQYERLLSRLEPGTCTTPIDLRYRGALTKASGTYSKTTQRKFAIRTCDTGATFRVWRTE